VNTFTLVIFGDLVRYLNDTLLDRRAAQQDFQFVVTVHVRHERGSPWKTRTVAQRRMDDKKSPANPAKAIFGVISPSCGPGSYFDKFNKTKSLS
jgi:hypothetical protein